jgi:hypothetical protein
MTVDRRPLTIVGIWIFFLSSFIWQQNSETRPTILTTGDPVGSQTTPIVDSEGYFVALYEHVLSSDDAASAMLHHLHTHIP